eukprot:scaffold2482_cov166-Amphora_coffeaeformis.AAC.27
MVMMSNQSSSSSEHIAQLLQYAWTNYESHPTDALLALLQALQLNSGQASATQAMERIRQELGSDIANHVLDRQGRIERAMRMVQQLLADESTLLFQQGNQHLLQQAMEDGSSVVCTKCNGMIPAARWQQHAQYWCSENNNENQDDEEEDDKERSS